MKKERNKNDQEVTDEKGGETKGKESFYTKDSELKSAFYFNKPMLYFCIKRHFLIPTNLTLYCVVLLSLFCKNLKIYFSRKFRKGYFLSDGSNIKLILCLVLPF